MTTSAPRFAMLRVAAASIEDSARMVAAAEVDDPIAALAVTTAAGPEVLGSAGAKSRAQETVTRYLARMGGRATPYGLFAGTALVEVTDQRRIELAPVEQHRVRTRVDVAALETIVHQALDAAPVAQWPLRVNPLSRTVGAVVRFARPGDATADVVSVRSTPFIVQVLRLLGDRTRSGRELAEELRAWRSELDPARVEPLLTQLVDVGLLERCDGLIEPGVEPVDRAVALLHQLGAQPQLHALTALVDASCGVRALAPGLSQQWQHGWQQAAAELPALAEVPAGRRYDLQLELTLKDRSDQLDRQTVDDLVQAVLRVQQINRDAADTADDTDTTSAGAGFSLSRFRTDFRARYEDAEVPLLAAVDLESGVLQLPRRQVSTLAVEAGVTSTRADTSAPLAPGVLSVYQRFAWNGSPVDISDQPPAAQLASRGILATLLDHHEGRYTSMLTGGVGRSPFGLMSRFALGRPEVAHRFERQLADESATLTGSPDAIRAELVYHPGGRIGNVLVRPQILPDTVALTGAGGGTISLERLTLRLHLDQFLLRDQLTGRPVVLELNTAHNVDLASLDPVYAILGRLAGGGGAGWSWGPLGRLQHLPRVTCGAVIVSPEQWLVPPDQVQEIRAADDPADRLRRQIKLSDDRRWLGVGSFDHILPIDLTSTRSVRAALARTGDDESARLVEMPQLESPAVVSPRGHHVAEVVLPVGPALRPTPRPPDGDSLYCPESGANWVYVRYHCGQSSADRVIVRAARLADQLREDGVLGDWFFVRYAADGYHVRVRMRADSPADRQRVLSELSWLGSRMRDDLLVGRVVIDDYVPEVARYGGARVLGHAERLFSASSAQVARLLATDPTEETRLYRAVADICDGVSLAHDDPAAQLQLLQRFQRGLSAAFAPRGNRQGKFFRRHRAALDDFLHVAVPDPDGRLATTEVLAAVRRSPTPDRLPGVLGSCLHMHCNRLFAFDAVRLEYLAYELALRKLRERAARRDTTEIAAVLPPAVDRAGSPVPQEAHR